MNKTNRRARHSQNIERLSKLKNLISHPGFMHLLRGHRNFRKALKEQTEIDKFMGEAGFKQALGTMVQAAETQLESVGGITGIQNIINGNTPSHSRSSKIVYNYHIDNTPLFKMIKRGEAEELSVRLNKAKPDDAKEVTVEEVIGRYVKDMLDNAGLAYYGVAKFKKTVMHVFADGDKLYTLYGDGVYMYARRITTKKATIIKQSIAQGIEVKDEV